jgi:hypothetical protein
MDSPSSASFSNHTPGRTAVRTILAARCEAETCDEKDNFAEIKEDSIRAPSFALTGTL